MTNIRENTNTCKGWACVDCLMILANGENNPEWSEAETAEHHARMDDCQGNAVNITVGCDTSECGHDIVNCAQDAEDHETECSRMEFSHRTCDTCGSTLGGAREAVTFWFVG